MKSPYTQGDGPYQDKDTSRTIFPEEERVIGLGFKFLGWNPTIETSHEFKHCMDAAHNYYSAFPNAWSSVQHTVDATDVTQSCRMCKIYWKVDLAAHVLA